MSEIVKQSLQRITKGTSMILIGTALFMILSFVGRMLIARYLSPNGYGLFALALAILNIAVIVATLGFKEGTARQVAYYRVKDDIAKVKSVIDSSISLSVLASIAICAAVFFSAESISSNIFHNTELIIPLKIFSLAIPFMTLIYVIVAVFRGFERTSAKVFFQDVFVSGLFLLLLVPVLVLKLPLITVFYAYLVSIIVACVGLIIYKLKKLSLPRMHTKAVSMRKKIITFSLPLLGFAMLGMIMSWTDTLMLGYFKGTDAVGSYNAALPIAATIPIFATSTVFIYVPVMVSLYSQNLLADMKRNYAVLTKWSFAVALPLAMVIVFFPSTILEVLFGKEYVDASRALQILCIGYAIQAFVGYTGSTLTAMGKTRTLLWTSLFSTILNVVLNAFLIPKMGMVGAAIASAISISLTVIILLVIIYRTSRIHPFTRNYLKPILASILTIAIMYFIVKSITVTWWMLLLFFVLVLIIYGISLLLTKSFDEEDMVMILEIERITGVKLGLLKNMLRKFT